MWAALLWLWACAGGGEVDTAEVDDDGDGFIAQYDCDDNNDAIYPTADEICDGVDNNCDGIVDDPTSADATTWYADADGDDYGNPAVSTTSCTPPPGFIDAAGDCDDQDASASPARAEVCDGVDNDCDGTVDNDPTDAGTWYADIDGDGYGDDTSKVAESCAPDATWTATGGDCDDSSAQIFPGAGETCGDGVVNDCDLTLDEARARCRWSSSLGASDADVWLTPTGADGQPGWSVAAGDLNGDAQQDLLIGAPGGDQAWLKWGPLVTTEDYQGTPSLTGDGAGLSVAVADLDTDGYDDIIVGSGDAAWVAMGPTTASRALSAVERQLSVEGAALAVVGDLLAIGAPDDGAVYLFDRDGTGEQSAEDAVAVLTGTRNTGAALAAAGDINGDGAEDLLVGAPDASAVWLLAGPISADRALATGDAWGASGWPSLLGAALSGLGDLNGDGYADIAMGAPTASIYSGTVGIVFGGKVLPSAGDVTDADIVLVSDYGLLLGGDVNPAGDIDHDGVPDVVVGTGYGVPDGGSAPTEDGPAEAYLFLSGGALAAMSGTIRHEDADVTFSGPQLGFGLRAAGVGDISGDGRPDLFISSGEAEETNYLFFGPGE